ncbi:MAG: phage baseplate assembly protein V [Vicinamibacterales bacterium]
MPTLPLDDIVRQSRMPAGPAGPWYGVYPAVVTALDDPDGTGRVRVHLPWLVDAGTTRHEAWARMATLAAGPGSGTWFMPAVGTEVLVAFEAGDARRPYVVGALWNGQDRPPQSAGGPPPQTQQIVRTRGGLLLTFDDEPGHERVVIRTPGGRTLTLEDGAGAVRLDDGAGTSVTLDATGVDVHAAARVRLTAADITLSAGVLRVEAGTATFSGVVQADTVITQTVVASTYTPGAGNLY